MNKGGSMDKILSARIEESIINQIGLLAKEMNTSKKSIIENAILKYAENVAKENKIDALEKTLGSWNRSETPGKTVKRIRKEFRNSLERYKR